MSNRASLTAEELRGALNYDPTTGEFVWLKRPMKKSLIGKRAGAINGRGYVFIGLNNESYAAQRLAWLYMTGEWPKHEIDHINGVKTDNRFENLRDVTSTVNQQNVRRARKGSATGILGVYRHRHGFRTSIQVGGVSRYIGCFETAAEAQEAYLKARRELHAGNTL